jgi:hypothetical protein
MWKFLPVNETYVHLPFSSTQIDWAAREWLTQEFPDRIFERA